MNKSPKRVAAVSIDLIGQKNFCHVASLLKPPRRKHIRHIDGKPVKALASHSDKIKLFACQPTMFSGLTRSSNSSDVMRPIDNTASFRVVFSQCAFLATCAAWS
jgi:hypothetical protein